MMTYNGAGGETKKAMAQTLGIASINSDTVNGASRQLLKSLHQPLGRRGFGTGFLSSMSRSSCPFLSSFLSLFVDGGEKVLEF
jgi:hypothetical protein